MKIFKKRIELIKEISKCKKLAFVPTMGALHKGHISLIKKAKKKSSEILVSIYINPKQFNSKKDFKKYPRRLKKDISILKKINISYLYIPRHNDIYSFIPKNKIFLDKFSKILCGKFRPLHFKGVINVVNRLLEITKPKFLYLGMKDFQQLILIKSHINRNKIKSNIIPCPTIRDESGVAISSRNTQLSKNQLQKAAKIYKFIKKNKRKIFHKIINRKKSEVVKNLTQLGAAKVDYVECINLAKKKLCKKIGENYNIFFAYYIGGVRLIDNL